MAYVTIPASGVGTTVVTDAVTIQGDGSIGDPIASIAASAANPGSLSIADFNKLATVPTGASIAVVAVSDVLDFTTTGVKAFGGNLPSLPGYKFLIQTVRILPARIEATSFSTAPTYSIGNEGGSFVNMCPSTGASISTTTLNNYLAVGSGGPFQGGNNSANASTAKIPDMTTQPSVNVTVAAAGTAVVHAKFRIIMFGLVSDALTTF